MEKLEKASRKWWFFVILLVAQSILLPIVSRNFDPQNVPRMVSVTLGNAVQNNLGNLNILFQSLSLLMLVLLVVFKNKVRTLFNAYVAVSYTAFAFIQNMAVTELYGFSVVTVNFAMFLFVAYVWIRELFNPENNYDFSNFHWKYSWMIVFALFAYLCPFTSNGEMDWNLLHFFTRNTATAFCLTTPLFLTILTLNLPKVNIVTYRITAIIGVIIGLYNMMNFFNPHTVWLGVVHVPLLTISLYSAILSYRVHPNS
ncbi:MAG: hypothetical protein J5603_07010 [Bacteroidales bacterium]|nr:hypothetical protein [Bacteroidales bacterium]MBR5652146.1 hypothetical protein [Bacteroidales bacterium]